jgi:hypothetical protein
MTNISLTGAAGEGVKLFKNYTFFFVFSIVLLYFMFIALSLNETKLPETVRKTLRIGIKKIHYILGAYLINILFFIVSIISFAFFLEKNLFLLLVSVILMIFSFVFGRIFMVNVVEKLQS